MRRARRTKGPHALGSRMVAVGLILISFSLAEGFSRMGWLDLLNNWHYDLFHHLRGVRDRASQVAIVSVDNQTLLQYRDEPLVFWGPRFARAIEVIRRVGARVIGLDYLLAVSPEAWLSKIEHHEGTLGRSFEIPMRQQLSKGSVVLVGVLALGDGQQDELLLPVEDYLLSLPNGIEDVGLANFLTDPDGVVRRFVPAILSEDSSPSLSFGALMAVRAAGLDPNAPRWELGGISLARTQPVLIGYMGPPGTVPRVSMARVLAPGAEKDPAVMALAGRVVILAPEHLGRQDLHLTPYAQSGLAGGGRLMSGAEIHANICESILSGRIPTPVSTEVRWLSVLTVVLVGTWWFMKVDPWRGLLGFLGMLLAYAAISYVLFLGDRVLPVAGGHSALAGCFLGGLAMRLRGEERERQRLRSLFGRYVSENVVERLLESRRKPQLGGEAVEITVLFSDIRGFTSLSERLAPQELVEVLNEFLGKACEAVLQEEGMIDKYVGDGVMAIFGWPIPYIDHAVRGLRAARRIAEVAHQMASWMEARFPGRGLPAFQVGVGVHTGLAVVGNIGSSRRMDFTAVGDTVNIASRLQGLCKELGWTVVASEATAQAARGDIPLEGEAYVTLRGKSGTIKVHGVTVGAQREVTP
ncbi:MAG: CHASE2 domain-containing protein [Thermodesulfobacteriota bacterium]